MPTPYTLLTTLTVVPPGPYAITNSKWTCRVCLTRVGVMDKGGTCGAARRVEESKK